MNKIEKTTEQPEGSAIKITHYNDGYWKVSIDSPPLNLLGPELLNGLEEVMRRVKASPKLCVMVFDRTVKDFFIAHFDILRGTEILSWKTKSGLLP